MTAKAQLKGEAMAKALAGQFDQVLDAARTAAAGELQQHQAGREAAAAAPALCPAGHKLIRGFR